MVKTLFYKVYSFSLYEWLMIVFAFALQVQVTLFAQGDYLGLRVGLGDLLLPFAGAFVIISLALKKSSFPKFYLPHTLWWLGALSLVMSVALINGYITTGSLSSWALINKYIGFYLLLSYFMLGAWAVHNSSYQSLALFVKAFVTLFIVTTALSVFGIYLQAFLPISLWLPNYPWDGLMANRNAFMVIAVLSFCFLIWGHVDGKIQVARCLRAVSWLVLPMFFVYNDSRTGWIAFGVFSVLFLLKSPLWRLKFALPFLCLGIGIAYFSYYLPNIHSTVMSSDQAQYFMRFVDNPTQTPEYGGDRQRFIAVDDALELYQKHDAMIGAGLGAYKPFQIEKRGEYINVMDFTGLWLLVETGAVGLFVFASFFIACSWCLYRKGFVEDNGGYYRAMFVFLLLFAGMSVLHELMYTRVLWFAMGLALARTVRDEWRIG